MSVFYDLVSLLLKFIFSEKATKFCEISTVDLTITKEDKSEVEILQNFVAFSEYMNFITCLLYQYAHVSKKKRIMFVHRWRYVSITMNVFYIPICLMDSFADINI